MINRILILLIILFTLIFVISRTNKEKFSSLNPDDRTAVCDSCPVKEMPKGRTGVRGITGRTGPVGETGDRGETGPIRTISI